MRKIKFRAKNRLNQWVYGVPCVYPEMKTDACLFNSYWTDDNGCLHETRFAIDDTNTVGQFTGLYDRHGKEIYEGDIITHLQHRIDGVGVLYEGYVEWRQEEGCYVFVDRIKTRDGRDAVRRLISCNDIRIIGNIHDNPELLKGGEK